MAINCGISFLLAIPYFYCIVSNPIFCSTISQVTNLCFMESFVMEYVSSVGRAVFFMSLDGKLVGVSPVHVVVFILKGCMSDLAEIAFIQCLMWH
jgi:hypothetical protein